MRMIDWGIAVNGKTVEYLGCGKKKIAVAVQSEDRRQALEDKEENVVFGGRLGEYKYYDMDQVIAAALEKSKELIN